MNSPSSTPLPPSLREDRLSILEDRVGPREEGKLSTENITPPPPFDEGTPRPDRGEDDDKIDGSTPLPPLAILRCSTARGFDGEDDADFKKNGSASAMLLLLLLLLLLVLMT